MHQQNKRYYELAEKWLSGTITKEEKAEFSEWYNNNENGILDIPEKFASSEDELRKRILSRIRIQQKKHEPVFSIKSSAWLRLAVASVVAIIAILSAFYFLTNTKPRTHENSLVHTIPQTDTIIPGGNKAMLVLGDGTKLVLDAAASGTIAEDAHTKVIKLDDGQLAYSSTADKNAPVAYHRLSTPRGGQYAITLTDGTKVWLNSASSLRFPSAFTDEERIVELDGEGYFEVAHHLTKPFKVKVNDIEVLVLGTHFNIMAYAEESIVNTTLLEGSVSIRKQKHIAFLKPGQQAHEGQNGKIRIIENADVEQAIAWKNGVFNFNGTDIQTTMRQIARWYDIEIIYEDKITEHFNGTIIRNASIERVLKMLEYTGVVHFRRSGRKVFVRSEVN